MQEFKSEYYIRRLKLELHPEGGYFSTVYRSIANSESGKLHSTSIYYLLEGTQRSTLHRLRSDELWHFYTGTSIQIYIIEPSGHLKRKLLGNDLNEGQEFQCCVPANHWFCAELIEPNSFALVGCTMAPGFDYEDFELADPHELSAQYPQHTELVKRFTKSPA